MKKELVAFLLSVGFYTSQTQASEYLNNLSPDQLDKLSNLSKQLLEKKINSPPVEKNGCIIAAAEKELDHCIIASGKKSKLVEMLLQNGMLDSEVNIRDYLNSLNVDETNELNNLINDRSSE